MPHPESTLVSPYIAQCIRLHRMDNLTNEFGNRAFDAGFPELATLLSDFSTRTYKQMNLLLDQELKALGVHDITTPESASADEYRLDSRIIAEKLGVEHESLIRLLDKYASQIRQFGVLRFEIGKPVSPNGGRPTRYALLNENQCYLLATLSRNTERVVDFKVWLVRTFAEHRQGVKPVSQPAELPQSATIRQWAAITGRSTDTVTRQIRRVFGSGFPLDTVLTSSQWIALYSRQETIKRLPKARYHTISGWLNLNNFRPESLEQSQQLGRRCTALSNELGYEIRKVPSEQFGEVNSYHTDVLKMAVPITKPPF